MTADQTSSHSTASAEEFRGAPSGYSSNDSGNDSRKQWRGYLYAAAVSCVVSLLIVTPFSFMAARRDTIFEFQCGVVARCCGAVEGRNRFSAMDRVGESWIRRAAIYFLSSIFVAARRRAEFFLFVDVCSGCFHRAGADVRGSLRVCACEEIFAAASFAFRRRLLRGESECAADYLHAQRLCGVTGAGVLSIDVFGGAAIGRSVGGAEFDTESEPGGGECSLDWMGRCASRSCFSRRCLRRCGCRMRRLG